MNDEKLTRHLQQWDCPVAGLPRFQSAVWQRIAAAEADKVNGWGTFWAGLWRPQGLVTAFALTALVSIGTASSTATLYNQRQKATLQRQYVQTIDPYLHREAAP